MPYYLHRQGVDPSQLALTRVYDPNSKRPDPDPYGPRQCDCEECARKFVQLQEARADWDRMQAEGQAAARILATFSTAAAAHAAKAAVNSPDPLVVTFKPTPTESRQWRERERYRQHVDRLPWNNEPWQIELDRLHHAYISVLKPGLIAYTPSEEFGHMDRQLAVRPGRYLEQFASAQTGGYFLHETGADPFTGEVLADGKAAQRIKAERGSHLWSVTFQRDAYCAMIKALDERNAVKFAATADDIEKVYRKGPSSCMSHPADDYQSEEHPVRVYGDSDLQCAYLGQLDGGRAEVRARAMVWPEQKIYSRVYGDDTLRILLERAGYAMNKPGESAIGDYGNLGGARIHAISHDRGDDVWTMPYIDACAVAVLTKDRKWFVLGTPSQYRAAQFGPMVSPCYETRNQNGLTNGAYGEGENDDDYSCAHCGDVSVDEEGAYCDTCADMRFRCVTCRLTRFEGDPAYLEDDTDLPVCESCMGRGRIATCDTCDNNFLEARYTEREQLFRNGQGLGDFCLECGADHLAETINGIEVEALAWLQEQRIAESKLVKARDKGLLLRAHSLDAPTIAAPLVPVVDRSKIKIIGADGTEVLADVRARFGAFVVHPPVLDLVGRRGWVVTHEPSTRRACRVKNLADAESLARELMTLGDWSDARPPYFHEASAIVGRYAVSARELD